MLACGAPSSVPLDDADDAAFDRPSPLLRARDVAFLFDASLQRIGRSTVRPPFRGALVSAAGRSCRFELDVASGTVERIQFRASPCISLIAYSEWICRRLEGWPLERAALLKREEVIDGVRGVRESRHLRVDLALDALRNAVTVASRFEERFGRVTRSNAVSVAWSI